MPYIPHTPEDIQSMLAAIKVDSIDTLFDEIPLTLRNSDLPHIPNGMHEMQLLQHAAQLAAKNRQGTCFIGAGCYEHHIPAAVWDITSRGEFLTAYTPYQAEASQGTLQLLYEFQTMIAELTGMDVANASMYDGASALAEAVLMALRLKKDQAGNHRILITGTIHPFYRDTLETVLCNHAVDLINLPIDMEKGITAANALAAYDNQAISALIIAQPNFFGCLEEVDTMVDWAHNHNVISIASVNPVSLGLLTPPGQWGQHGVDIVCGEGQPLGVPMASGGPFFGFFSTRLEYVRQMPGRLIGRTVDKDGKTGFSLTLQAREQHIRRAKATSNICTNQGLLVTAATIHLSLLGAEGLSQTARLCHHNTQYLLQRLTAIPGVTQAFNAPYFHEVVITLPGPVDPLLKELSEHGIEGGFSITPYYPALKNALLVCATEMRTTQDIDHYAQVLEKIIHARGN